MDQSREVFYARRDKLLELGLDVRLVSTEKALDTISRVFDDRSVDTREIIDRILPIGSGTEFVLPPTRVDPAYCATAKGSANRRRVETHRIFCEILGVSPQKFPTIDVEERRYLIETNSPLAYEFEYPTLEFIRRVNGFSGNI